MRSISSYFRPKTAGKKRGVSEAGLTEDSGEYATPRLAKKKVRADGCAEDSASPSSPTGDTGGPRATDPGQVQESLCSAPISDVMRAKIAASKEKAKQRKLAKERARADPYAHLEDLIPDDWRELLQDQFSLSYWRSLKESLQKEQRRGKRIFPKPEHIFRAFRLCPLDKIKVVIIGQDPYHNTGQAEGLCFSVPRGMAIPSSLRNIFKELQNDIPSFRKPGHGSLVKWAKQGIFLLNTGLTVRAHEANSHKKFGWQQFTDAVVNVLNKKKGLVFVLWGGHAQKKAAKLTVNRHCIVKSVHPSGLSAHRGFFGSKPFSKVNKYLTKNGKEPIQWQT